MVGMTCQKFLIVNVRGMRLMRFATLCVAVCLAQGVSVISLSERPDISVPDIHAAVVRSADAAPATSSASAYSASPSPAGAGARATESNNDGSASPERQQRTALSRIQLCETAIMVAQANDLPAPFFTRLIQQESGFKPHIVSSAGAQGIAQFMPRTAASVGLVDPFDPTEALAASGKFLAELVTQFGNLGLAAAAYNAGSRRVQDWIGKRGQLPLETRRYVYNITGHAAEAWAASSIPVLGLAPQTVCSNALSLGVEQTHETRRNIMPDLKNTQVSPPAGARSARATVTERHSLPRPSRFAVGLPVPEAIKASERSVVAKQDRIHRATNRSDRKTTRIAADG